MEKKEKNHAERNAEGHAESILEMYRVWKALEDGAEMVTVEGAEYTDSEYITQRAHESILSLEVRSDWHVPGDKEMSTLTEYRLLLSTGGPALQIVGDLSEYSEPENAKLQHQDWGTPWIDYEPKVAEQDDWQDALMWFVGCFYFGE